MCFFLALTKYIFDSNYTDGEKERKKDRKKKEEKKEIIKERKSSLILITKTTSKCSFVLKKDILRNLEQNMLMYILILYFC